LRDDLVWRKPRNVATGKGSSLALMTLGLGVASNSVEEGSRGEEYHAQNFLTEVIQTSYKDSH
jgi:hypothetical protein